MFERGVAVWVTLRTNFTVKGVIHQRLLVSEDYRPSRAPGLSRGVVCVIVRFAVLIQYRRVTHRHTDAIMASTRAPLAPGIGNY